MATLTSTLVAKLIDQISAPARGAAKALAGIGEAARRVNGAALGNIGARLGEAAQRNAQHMDALRGKMLDAAAMGYGLARALNAPLAEARNFESVLLDIGQKANLSDRGIASLSKKIGDLSVELQKTLSQGELAKGVDFLAGMGLDPDKALTMLKPIGRAAHAYKADVEDLARAGYAAFDNLQVPAEQFAKALDVMAQSGKEGAFELRDMAQYFPSLGSSFQGLGQKGVGAVADLSAALQVTRKGAGDSAEAANNLANLLQKIVSPDAVKNFREFGIDIRKELEKAQKNGVSPIEMIAEQTNKALKGNLSNISDLFADAQVQKALRPLIMNIEEYREIRKRALSAEGVVNDDFARRLLTGDAALDQFKNRMADLGRTIGAILLPAVNDLLGLAGEWASKIADVAEAHPQLTKAVVVLTTALVAFRTAAIAAAFATTFMRGGLIGGALAAVTSAGRLKGLGAVMFAPFLAFGTRIKGILQTIALRFRLAQAAGIGFGRIFVVGAMATFGRALIQLLNPLALVTAAMKVLKLAVIGTGIGAVLVGIAMAGTWIYNNWQGIGVAFEAFKGAFDRAIAPIKPALQPIINGFSSVADWVGRITGALDNGTWAQWGLAAGRALGELVVSAKAKVDQIIAVFRGLPATIVGLLSGLAASIRDAFLSGVDYAGAGAQIIASVWSGMKGALDAMCANIRSALASAFAAPSMGSLWGTGPTFNGKSLWGGEGAAAPATPTPAPARARGGRVQQGRPYWVNDDGSRDPGELFVPGRSGTILPASERRKLEAGAGGGGGSVSVSMPVNITVTGNGDPRAMANEVSRIFEAETQRKIRGVFADIGLRNA